MSETMRASLFEQLTSEPQLSVGERASEATSAVVNAYVDKSVQLSALINANQRYWAAIDAGVPQHKAWNLLTLDADDIASARRRIVKSGSER